MQISAFLALAGAVMPLVAALPPLERNIAYRSPSTTVTSRDLAHDIDAIARRVVKRDIDYENENEKENENEAEALVEKYDGEYGPDGKHSYKGNMTFPFGVASGDPLDDSAILWTHPVPTEKTTRPICLRYEVSSSKNKWGKEELLDDGYAWTTEDVDYSFKVETTGLKPLQTAYYRFSACHDHSIQSEVGRFRTMPSPDDDKYDSLKLAVFSCSNLPFGYFNSFSQASKKDHIDYAMHVGDYIYEAQGDGTGDSYGDGKPLDRVPLPNREISSLYDYRTRYASYRGMDEGLRALHQSHAWILVWDDHEVADNTWNAGSADSNNTKAGTVNGIEFTERKRNAVKAYFEWMPIRQVDTTDSLRIWRKFQVGKLADILMLDTRQYDRDITDVYYNTDYVASISNDTNRSLMGGKQERWFYDNLQKSQNRGAIWKIVGQQIIVNHLNEGSSSFPIDYDAWDGYKANRRRMLKTIKDNKIDNTIFLAGDSHAAWVYDTPGDENGTDYNPATGEGSYGVEFAGTAVSSPSSYGTTLTPAEYLAHAKQLVTINKNLHFAEGALRGYFEVEFTKEECNAQFYGIKNNTLPNSPEILLASFNVKRGANHLTRPINGGKKPASGAIQAQVVDYKNMKWNGTAFA